MSNGQNLSSRDLFVLNGQASVRGDKVAVEKTGAELMRRTDTSPERRETATTEQAERRAEMRRSGADRQYV